MNWRIIVSNGRVSEEEYYISGSSAAIIVYGQLPPRSWSTIKIGCYHSPQSLSTAAIRIHHQLRPRSWSTTIIRCQQDKGSAIIITISQHDTEFAILDPPLWSLRRDPQIIIHVATAGALDLRLDKAKGLWGRSQVSNMYWWDMNFFDMITIEKRKEKLQREALSVLCPPTF